MYPRVNLFIADDVGLDKTIEAGLIARELLLRKKVREIVVSCPPSVYRNGRRNSTPALACLLRSWTKST